jgi:hypothetical protein
MGTTKKPRRKYRPKPVLVNPLGYVLESMTRVADLTFPLVDLKIKNHMAMVALLRGDATKYDMDVLIAMSNITEALWRMGFGTEYQNVCIDGRYAILSIIDRAQQHGRFTPRGPEITMLNTLMELHDAQMEIITVKDMEKAITLAKKRLAAGNAVKLPFVPEQQKERRHD